MPAQDGNSRLSASPPDPTPASTKEVGGGEASANTNATAGAMALIWTLVVFMVLGLLVLAVKPDYRIASNIESNEDFFPSVKVDR